MKRFWMIGCATLALGCVDLTTLPDRAEPQSPGEEVRLPDATIEYTDEKADAYPKTIGHLARLVPPSVEGCAEASMIGTANLANREVGQPLITERFGADGCLDERWIREWDGDRPLSEFYDFFDPEIARYVYVQPYAYTHVWEYDAEGRLAVERRAEGDSDDFFFSETFTYDDQGRVVEKVRENDIWAPQTTIASSREVTTFHESGQILEKLYYYDGELSSTERRVFDDDGNEVELWRGRSGTDELLVRRHTYDDGMLDRVESFDHRGTLDSTTEHDRRADGTLAKTVTHRHQLGFVDTHIYDEAEREILYTQDSTRDGVPEFVKVSEYDGDGNMTFTSTSYDFDSRGNAGRYSETRWSYDAEGRVVEQIADPQWLPEGTVRRTRWDYLASGHIATTERVAANGQVGTEHVVRVTDDDRTLWEKYDADRDGVAESVTVNRWDGERQLEKLHDADGDGFADMIEQWFYDAADQLVEHRRDIDGDSVVDYRELFAR